MKEKIMKNIITKSLQITLLISLLNTILSADKIKSLSNTLWQRTFPNTCTESFTFNPSTNIFTFISSFGKKMIGSYVVETVKSSKRLKITFRIKLDNGLKDCTSTNYNTTNQTMVNYLWLENNEKNLNVTMEEASNLFNTYTKIEVYTQENLTLLQDYLAQIMLNEMKKTQSNLTNKTLEQQIVEIQKKQNKDSIALNKKIFEQLKEFEEKRTESNDKSWKDYLSTEQLIEQQKFENKLVEEKRIQDNTNYHEESYRHEAIQNNSLQESYIQEQITQDYYNGY
jgi:hypothetical protein